LDAEWLATISKGGNNMTPVPILVGILILTVTFLIRAEFAEKKLQIYILKPVSTLLIVTLIILSFFIHDQGFAYKVTILVGMLFCLGGDIALMFDSSKAFMVGLVLFLTGHIVYTVSLVLHNGFLFDGFLTPLIVGLISSALFVFLYSSLDKMKLPVLFYVVVISFMLSSALLSYRSEFFNTTQAWHLASGATLFYVSDVILAINKFKLPFRLHRISLAFYFSGQALIALSTHYM
jgi:uncharacterized membrane protein YhhN